MKDKTYRFLAIAVLAVAAVFATGNVASAQRPGFNRPFPNRPFPGRGVVAARNFNRGLGVGAFGRGVFAPAFRPARVNPLFAANRFRNPFLAGLAFGNIRANRIATAQALQAQAILNAQLQAQALGGFGVNPYAVGGFGINPFAVPGACY